MPFGYISLSTKSPRSFLFSVVANVGPHGASRSLAVAYRQGSASLMSLSTVARVERVVADILALIDIFSDPANRVPLEAERVLAKDWYCRSQRGNQAKSSERPSVPDTPQPPFATPDDCDRVEQEPLRPELPWHGDTLSEFPFSTTCLLLGLLRDDGDGDANANTANSTRPGDVQLQPLSTVFRGDCAEYGLIVLDISDLNRGVQYGIVAFPVRYMAEVYHRGEKCGWDYVEDRPPEKEPDVVLFSPRPRVPLSILRWLRKYIHSPVLENDPSVLRLEERPVVDAAALDYIWPPELENPLGSSSTGVISSISHYFWPSKSTTRAKDASTAIASGSTTSQEPLRHAHIDRAIDNLLTLTRKPADPNLEKRMISKFQESGEFRDQLRWRLEEVPDSLGPSSKISAHILRVAYAGRTHLNWVMFRSLAPGVIAVAIASDELQSASALSLCIDNFNLEEDEEDFGDLIAALAQSRTLEQLCFLQKPDRDSDYASARFCTRLLLRRRSSDSLEWLRDKTIYSTCAFSTALRSRKFTSPSTTAVTFTSTVAQIFPIMHMFRFVGHQREDITYADHHLQQHQNNYSNSYFYDMSNTLLDAERFTVRFLSYLYSVGSGSDKAIFRFAYGEASVSSLTTSTTNDDKSLPPSSSSGPFAVSPIPVGFLGNHAANDLSRVRIRDTYSGSWVLLLHQQGRSSSDDDNFFLQYSFIRVRQASSDNAPEQQEQQQQQRPIPIPNFAEVVGGLTEFLRQTVPGTDISTCEKRVEKIEKDLRARQASIKSRKSCIRIGVMAESNARALFQQLM